MNHTRALAALPLALAAFALVGCSAAPDGGNDAANDALAVKFVACLNENGQTAKIIDGGQVGMLMPEDVFGSSTGTLGAMPGDGGAEGAEAVTVGIFMDDEGSWMAASAAEAYPEEGGYREAWQTCADEIPDFEQPMPDISGGAGLNAVSQEDVIEKSLAFAECARGEGWADFPDPDDQGMIDFPVMGEDEFRSLLEACLDTSEDGFFGVPVSQESAKQFDFDWFAVMNEFMGGNIMMGTAVPVSPIG